MHDTYTLDVMRQAGIHKPFEALAGVFHGAAVQVEACPYGPFPPLQVAHNVATMTGLEIQAVIGIVPGGCVAVRKRPARPDWGGLRGICLGGGLTLGRFGGVQASSAFAALLQDGIRGERNRTKQYTAWVLDFLHVTHRTEKQLAIGLIKRWRRRRRWSRARIVPGRSLYRFPCRCGLRCRGPGCCSCRFDSLRSDGGR